MAEFTCQARTAAQSFLILLLACLASTADGCRIESALVLAFASRLSSSNLVNRLIINPSGVDVHWQQSLFSIYIDGSDGADEEGCGASTVTACKTIRYGYTQRLRLGHQQKALELLVNPGVYQGECSETGIEVTTADTSIRSHIKSANQASLKVIVDCGGHGKLLSVSQPMSSQFELQGIHVRNGGSMLGGGLFVENGSLSIYDCSFEQLESIQAANSNSVDINGGGAIAVTQGVAIVVQQSTFVRCVAPTGVGGAMAIELQGKAAKVSIQLREVSFNDCRASTNGGAVFVSIGAAEQHLEETPVLVLVEEVGFHGSILTATGKDNAWGGGLFVTHTVTVATVYKFRACNFTNAVLQSETGTVLGGGVILKYYGDVVFAEHTFSGCIFDGNRLHSSGGRIVAGGGFQVNTYADAQNVSNKFTQTVFRHNSLTTKATNGVGMEVISAQGAGAEFEHVQGVRNLSLELDACTFEHNTAAAPHGRAAGGGLDLVMIGEAVGVLIRWVGTIFRNNTLLVGGDVSLDEDGNADGAGAKLGYQGSDAMASILHELIRCSFEHNRAIATGKGGFAHGGGLNIGAIDITEITGFATLIADSIFANNKVVDDVQTGSGSNGGGLYVRIGLAGCTEAASAVDTIVRSTEFLSNTCRGYGGGALVASEGNAVGQWQTLFEQCIFEHNRAINGSGGAISYEAVDTFGTSLVVHECRIGSNNAGSQGGGIHAVQDSSNPPANLLMDEPIDLGADSVPRYACYASFQAATGNAREWHYAGAFVLIDASDISDNTVGTNDGSAVTDSSGDEHDGSTDVLGAGLFIVNFNTTIHDSNMTANLAFLGSGGAIALGAGSARLTLKGDTKLEANQADESGSAIYSSSGGGILLRDTVTIDFVAADLEENMVQAVKAGMTVLKGGKIEYSGKALLRCAEGEQLVNELTSQATTFDGWIIDCATVVSKDNGSRIEFTNPTCDQLRIGNSALHTEDCANMPLTPSMLSSSGSISCLPCPNLQYSFDHGLTQPATTNVAQAISEGPVHAVDCLPCPYGASCASGGASVRADAGFWGTQRQLSVPTVRRDVDVSVSQGKQSQMQSQKLEVELVLLACPDGFCCSNRSHGCAWDSDNACLYHRSHAYPLCGGCRRGFSQAIDGVGCVPDSSCGGRRMANYVLLQLSVVWCPYALYALYSARYRPLLQLLPTKLLLIKKNSGTVAVLVVSKRNIMRSL